MEFTVTLSKYNYSQGYDRDQFIALFPESMISQALELDKGATNIVLNISDVTPYVLMYINRVIHIRKLPIPATDISQAGKYLLIPLLEMVSDLRYVEFHTDHSEVNLLDHKSLDTYYDTILQFGVYRNWNMLIFYLLDIIPIKMDYNYIGVLVITTYHNNVPCYNRLRPYIKNPLLTISTQTAKRFFPEFGSKMTYLDHLSQKSLINIAVESGKTDILRLIAQDPAFITEDNDELSMWTGALYTACHNGNMDQIDIITSLVSKQTRIYACRYTTLEVMCRVYSVKDEVALLEYMISSKHFDRDILEVIKLMKRTNVKLVLQNHLDFISCNLLLELHKLKDKGLTDIIYEYYSNQKNFLMMSYFNGYIPDRILWKDIICHVEAKDFTLILQMFIGSDMWKLLHKKAIYYNRPDLVKIINYQSWV